MNENQTIVLNWLKEILKRSDAFSAISTLVFFDVDNKALDESNIQMCVARNKLHDEELLEVLKAFANYGLKDIEQEQTSLF